MRKTANRKKLIQLIHVARRDVAGLKDEDTYRAMLLAVTGCDSCSDMSDDQLQNVLEHLKNSGFKVRSRAKPSRPLADDADSKKIRAIWLMLHHLGVVKNPSEEALAAYVKRQTGVDALQWLNGEQSLKVIETLKKWAMRFLPEVVKRMEQEASNVSMSLADRNALDYAVSKALRRNTYDPMAIALAHLSKALKTEKAV